MTPVISSLAQTPANVQSYWQVFPVAESKLEDVPKKMYQDSTLTLSQRHLSRSLLLVNPEFQPIGDFADRKGFYPTILLATAATTPAFD